jgi:hypothetical protein
MTNPEGMGSMIKKIWHKFSQGGEKGQALVLVLILLIVGALVIAPLMANIGTGLKAGEVHEEKANELYAADAGIEDGLWQVKNDKVATKFPTYEPYDYYERSGDNWTYPLAEIVNGQNVTVNIKNMWMPMGLAVPSAASANITLKGTAGNPPKLIMTGTVIDVPTGSTPGSYRIKIEYSDPQNLLINTLGIWLPPGFTYVAGSNNLDDPANPGQKIYSSESLSAYKSGQAVVWTFANYPFGLDASHHFPGVNPAASPMESTITFQFNGTTGGKPAAVAWINTNLDLGGGITYTWDGDKQIYEITSTAGNTTIDGYTIKSELREMAAAIEGDYYATGNTLMRDAHPDSYHIRDTWLSSDHSSSNNIPAESPTGAGNGVPQDAEVEFAYLYWTSWWDDSNKIAVPQLNPDTCSTYNNWDRSGSSPYFNTSWGGDGNVFSGHFGAGGLDSFRYLTLKDGRVDLSPYAQGLVTVSWDQGITLVSQGFADSCYNFNNWNRTTPNVWNIYPTTGPNSGKYFQGHFSTGDNTNIDMNSSLSLGAFTSGTVTVSWKQWETYSSSPTTVWSDNCRDFGDWSHPTPSAWDDLPNYFSGHFSSGNNRNITHSEDLSAYASGGTVTLSWDQWRSGTLESSDGLDVAFSNDGTNWSTQASYRGSDFGGTAQTKSLPIPSQFLTSGFRVRFSLVDCADSGEYINLDTINITYTPAAPGPNDGLDIAYSDDDGATWGTPIPVFRGVLGTSRPPANNVTLTVPDGYLTDRFRIRFILVGFGTSGQYLNLDDITVTCPPPLDPGPGDGLDFAFSRDGGANWSNNIQAFRQNASPSNFTYTIPSGYLTSQFKMRFYLVGFGGAGQYCDIDNIKITAMMPDSSVFFKINGQQVYFDASGQPQQGTQDITADPGRSQVIISIQGFSYSCFKDVTALVRAFSPSPTNPPTNRPGIANYTVGGVNGTLGDDNPSRTQMSHAGWSLIIIYSSQATLGHQLYIYDQFTHAFDYDDVDFDADSNPGPGGTISGFIVPDPIQGEVNAAKITIMVGEGDDWIAGGSGYAGDFVAFNAPLSYRTPPRIPARDIPNSYKLWDGKLSVDVPGSNTQSAPNNVWNGLSTAFNYDGIDVDTFYIPWGNPVSTGLLKPGDTSARLDLCTAQDNWNLVYVIISFRSKTTTGGTVTYRIR